MADINQIELPNGDKFDIVDKKSGYIAVETDPLFSVSAAAGITASDITNWNGKSDFSGSYNDLTNKPTIPDAVSITRKTTSGTNIADITIGSTTTQLYAPNGGQFISGTTATLTPSDVASALASGYNVELIYTDATFGQVKAYSFNYGDSVNEIVANLIFRYGYDWIVYELHGNTYNDTWAVVTTTIPKGVFIAEYGVTSYANVKSAYDDGATIFCSFVNNNNYIIMQLANFNSHDEFFAFVVPDGSALEYATLQRTEGWNNGLVEYATTNVATTTTNGLMSASDKSKLDGIEDGAEENVQSDWNVSDPLDVAYILNKPTIPIVPTNVSAFTNDAGYLTSFTETDPTVPSWAKATTKPTYTASEVGALPSSTTYVSKVTTTAGAHSAISNQSGSVSFNVPTNTSHLTNDSGFITISSVPSNWVNGSATGSIRGIGAAEEDSNYTMGIYAVAEGIDTAASGGYSHAEGTYTTASGVASHAEGYDTAASGGGSHAEGTNTIASGGFSHAEGINTTAGGNYSHSQNNNTKALSNSQTALGKYNIGDTQDTYAVIIGNGTADNARSNALTVDWDGNVETNGSVTHEDMSAQDVSDFVDSLEVNGIVDGYMSLDTTAASGTRDGDLYTAITTLSWQNDTVL